MKQTALITGASMGLGAEFARLFAEQHINLVLVARNKEKLMALAETLRNKHGIDVLVFACDLSQMNEVQALYETCENNHIQIDYLVNNAGSGDFALFHEAEYAKLEQMIDLNIKALTKLSHLLVKPMIQRGFGR
ncbi:MAG: SDR family NAD(P)-dependent oxidoreductase, partial [Chitinophagaceae bacterium]|nr:SDR family NAD(P)-dependent oxidoreductase [Chitinophagaceae bacterium]